MKKLVCILLIVLTLSACSFDISLGQPKELSDGSISACIIDVGNADCSIIRFDDGSTMMIDAGDTDSWYDISFYLKYLGITEIDWLVLTHPHSDHIGCAERLIKNYTVKSVYMPSVTHTSELFINLLETMDEMDIPVNAVKDGDVLKAGNADVIFLGPINDYGTDLNNWSIVTAIDYNGKSMLFTGDIEKSAADDIVEEYSVYANFLKVPHHGAASGGSEEFYYGVYPEYAAITCGKGNTHGHPHKETLDTLNDMGTKVYRSDINGNITVEIDKNGEMTVTSEF